MGPRWAKIHPRWPQMAEDAPRCTPFRIKNRHAPKYPEKPRKHRKTHEKSLIFRVRWLGFRHQNSSFGAKLGQDAAKMAQDSAKMSQDSAKMGQEGAKMPQDGAKIGQDGPRLRQDGPSCGQTGVLVRSWGESGSTPGRDAAACGAHAAQPGATRKRLRPSWGTPGCPYYRTIAIAPQAHRKRWALFGILGHLGAIFGFLGPS